MVPRPVPRGVVADQSIAADPATVDTRIRGGRYAHWHVEPPADREEEGWLIAYLDMMTLLLVMLVILLAFSDRDIGVWLPDPYPAEHPAQHSVLEGLPGIFEGLPAPEPTPEVPARERVPDEAPTGLPVESPDPLAGLPLDRLGDDVEILVEDGTISFRISNEILFPSGQAALTAPGLALLDRLVEVLNATELRIAVEGHTDDVPIQTERFPSNWELSTGRATSVVRHLAAQGVAAGRLRATGYADTRPIASNDTPEGRAINRRVELIMETAPLR